MTNAESILGRQITDQPMDQLADHVLFLRGLFVTDQPRQPLGTLRACRAVTVNRVSGVADRIAELQQIWNPEVESMEGAAFFQVCLMSGVPFRAFRSISNRVEPRNRANWHLREAVEAAQSFVMGYLDGLSHKKEENP